MHHLKHKPTERFKPQKATSLQSEDMWREYESHQCRWHDAGSENEVFILQRNSTY